MMTINGLEALGANPKRALSLCNGNEEFYLGLVRRIVDDPRFDLLDNACGAGDRRAVIEAAEALCETSANLSLTPLSDALGALAECLREKSDPAACAACVARVRVVISALRAM